MTHRLETRIAKIEDSARPPADPKPWMHIVVEHSETEEEAFARAFPDGRPENVNWIVRKMVAALDGRPAPGYVPPKHYGLREESDP